MNVRRPALRRYLVLLAFAVAAGGILTLLVTFILGGMQGYHVLIDMNHFGEYWFELITLIVALPLIVYGVIDYVRMWAEAEGGP